MKEIFAIAEEELIIAFKMIGVEGVAVTGLDDALSAFRETVAAQESCRMLILTEDVADMLGSELINWQLTGRYPLIVEIPPLSGSSPDHVKLVDAVRQAIGIKIQ